MQKSILISILLLFVMSCKNSIKNQPVDSSTLTAPTQTIKDSGADLNGIEESLPESTDILTVLDKMKNKKKLTDADYGIIDGFLLQNKNESLSEEAGYTLFEYLKGNKSNNDVYLSYLNKKSNIYKENILNKLIQIMCIDLGEDNYTYEKLITDFSIFKQSKAAQKSFKTCMDNQVE